MQQLLSKVTIAHGGELEAKIFKAICIAFAACICIYVYLVGQTTLSVIERKELESDAQVLVSHISSLELDYLSKSSMVTLTLAHERGFMDVNPQAFAARLPALRTLSVLSNNEL
jgi:hypothetical protein